MSRPDRLPLFVWFMLAIGITVAALAVLVFTTGCKQQANGDSQPQSKHTTSVGPSKAGKASIIPKDDTVEFPKNQDETDYATAHGATWICGDGGLSFKKTPDACVGHGGPSEVIRK